MVYYIAYPQSRYLLQNFLKHVQNNSRILNERCLSKWSFCVCWPRVNKFSLLWSILQKIVFWQPCFFASIEADSDLFQVAVLSPLFSHPLLVGSQHSMASKYKLVVFSFWQNKVQPEWSVSRYSYWIDQSSSLKWYQCTWGEVYTTLIYL